MRMRLADHDFEIVDHVPRGYRIWNIGRNMPDGYLPICMLKPPAEQPFEGGREIRVDTLKAIPIEGAQTILQAASHGGTRKEMQRKVEKYEDAEPGTYKYTVRERLIAALALMKDLVWDEEVTAR